ncbi:hypothetical protein Tco_1377393 [Tanacetum coccineum]
MQILSLSKTALTVSICSSLLTSDEYESLNLLPGGRSTGAGAIDLETGVDDSTSVVGDLHLLRDGLAEGEDESNDLSEVELGMALCYIESEDEPEEICDEESEDELEEDESELKSVNNLRGPPHCGGCDKARAEGNSIIEAEQESHGIDEIRVMNPLMDQNQKKMNNPPNRALMAAKTKYDTNLARLLPKQIYSPSVVDWELLDAMRCGEEIEEMLEIKLVEWVFNEVVHDDDLWSSKSIKFRLARRDHSLTLLQFAKRLGLCFNEVGEEGFEIYFRSGLCSDEHFNAREYWLSISRVEDLHLSRVMRRHLGSRILRVLKMMIRMVCVRETNGHDKVQKNDLWLLSMFEAKNQDGYANVAWVMAKWMKKKGDGSQRESMICCGQFITRMA